MISFSFFNPFKVMIQGDIAVLVKDKDFGIPRI